MSVYLTLRKMAQLIFWFSMTKNVDGHVTWIEENHNMGESVLGNDVLF